jgi:hypothetical protein
VTIYISNIILAIFFPDINLFFNLIGSLAASTICYILPAAFYIWTTEDRGKIYRGSWVIFVAGIVSAAVGLCAEIYKLSSGQGS